MSTSEEVGCNRPQECPREVVTSGDVISARSHDRFSSFFLHSPSKLIPLHPVLTDLFNSLQFQNQAEGKQTAREWKEKELEWSRMGFWTQVKGEEMICVVIRMWTDENGKA